MLSPLQRASRRPARIETRGGRVALMIDLRTPNILLDNLPVNLSIQISGKIPSYIIGKVALPLEMLRLARYT
jgi:hypothetical protein